MAREHPNDYAQRMMAEVNSLLLINRRLMLPIWIRKSDREQYHPWVRRAKASKRKHHIKLRRYYARAMCSKKGVRRPTPPVWAWHLQTYWGNV